ncbi:uncharacterized protein LOC105700276 [Orussus abietinus]|uniref:uncharacterized protein LOC105700276 n=1 Tax=Orussus abietinus TaxID=222816 RepID=UPI0006266AF2|nr:uncharacterized protein LOC105700276 [Orussus abietinus]XP_012281380.1 uncharacterized protein LOC105700276 [Orussus abietinus]XP_012281381.1 uncharacterized protein LOC105700276 [Orussus abietinus]XP_012281382.1 uncharacterized protein LOC105700276 [Orussus abietinus]XP_012281383.1 uncharacterized protein LOC105700276 [Orussus abietinus]XP_012281384.1 uncharacterized protein LOC105700276 [Orussus abietinus]XP_012281385.1 uncharacterized protein LOC105700276 [Orussus abietinus]
MEVTEDSSKPADSTNTSAPKEDIFEITSNWIISNDRCFRDTISTVALSKAMGMPSLEEMVSLNTCVQMLRLPRDEDCCTWGIKVTNGQKIARVAVVSEASVLEFYKQCGEYWTTAVAEFVDEFDDKAVYITEVSVEPPSTEIRIKFVKTKYKRPVMWLYGIRLVLTEPMPPEEREAFDFNVINNFLPKSKSVLTLEKTRKLIQVFSTCSAHLPKDGSYQGCHASSQLDSQSLDSDSLKVEESSRKLENHSSSEIKDLDIQSYIDNKFKDIEQRLMQRIEQLEFSVSQKLDTILKKLEEPRNSS